MSKSDLEKLLGYNTDTPVSIEKTSTPKESKVPLTNKESTDKISKNKKTRSAESIAKEKAHKLQLMKKQKLMLNKITTTLSASTKTILKEYLIINKPISFVVTDEFTGKKHRFKLNIVKR